MGEAKHIYFTCLKYYYIIFKKRSNMGEKKVLRSVQVFGRKKTSTAVAHCKSGKGLIKVNGRPLHLVEPRTLRQSWRSPCCCWARTVSRRWTFAFASTAAVTSLKSTLFVKPFPSLWWLIIRNTWTKLRRRRSRIS